MAIPQWCHRVVKGVDTIGHNILVKDLPPDFDHTQAVEFLKAVCVCVQQMWTDVAREKGAQP